MIVQDYTPLLISGSYLSADELKLLKSYDQILSYDGPLHPLAFIHKGPSDMMVNCSYLVNGTMIYQINDGSPGFLIHLTGEKLMCSYFVCHIGLHDIV